MGYQSLITVAIGTKLLFERLSGQYRKWVLAQFLTEYLSHHDHQYDDLLPCLSVKDDATTSGQRFDHTHTFRP